jgi:omega-6 fatty acid desaturase (delta-12 desaturase)
MPTIAQKKSAPRAKPAPAPLGVKAARTFYRGVGAVAPGLAGRVAARHFMRSRTGKAPLKDMAPLGATAIQIHGGAPIRNGYHWGSRGPAVLLVHGWGSDSSSMYSLVAPLQKRGFRVVAFDAPAHGTQPGTHTTMTAFKSAVAGVIDTVGGVHAVIAHSLGGIAAVSAIAAGRLQPPQRLVLVSAPCSLPTVIERWSRFLSIGNRAVLHMKADLKRRNGVPVDHWDIAERGCDFDGQVIIFHDHDDSLVPFCEAEKIAIALRHTKLRGTAGLGHRRILFDPAVQAEIVDFLTAPQPAMAQATI